MRRNTLVSALSILSSFSVASPTPEPSNVEAQTRTSNANHIFNAVHSSMRQWGSSLNHNGMSFFLATVPEGTQLYHGTSNPESVKGMEWLAFEPEHALIFAHPRGGPGRRPPPGEGRPGEGPPEDRPETWDEGGERRPMPPKGHHGDHSIGKERPPPPPHHGPPPFDGPHHGPPPPPPPPGHHKGNKSGHRHPPPHGEPPFFKKPHHEQPPPLGHGPNHPPPSDDDEGMPMPPPRHPHEQPHHPHGSRPDDDESHFGPPHERPHQTEDPDCDHFPPPPHKHPDRQYPDRQYPDRQYPDRQHPLLSTTSEPTKTGYLHTYVPKHDLKLLYIDGMSAGKTSNGTLDTQDILLLNLTSHGAMGGEYERAQGLCNLSSTLWENKIDGVLRMEGGFEIILCNFKKHLETRDIMPVVDNGWGGGPMGGWQYQKAITERYHGIGGGRVILDYENFVTAYEYEGLDLWDNDVVSDTPQPRLQKASEEELKKIKDAVTAMILHSKASEKTTNWQAIAGEVVKRYSAPLHHLHTSSAIRSSKEAYATYLSTLLRPFVDHTSRNSSLETARCIQQFIPALPLPPSNPPSLAHRSIYAVAQHLCITLLSASDIAMLSLSRSLSETSPPPSGAVQLVDGLKEYLQWTSWKECGGCSDTEICVVPIWPMGSHEQHANPKCQGEGESRSSGYWGHRGMGRPPPGEGPPDEDRDGREPGVRGNGMEGGRGRQHDRNGGRCSRRGRKGAWTKVKMTLKLIEGWFRGRI